MLPQPGATGPAPPGSSFFPPAAPLPLGAISSAPEQLPALSPMESDLIAVLGDLGLGGVPATLDALRNLELSPAKIAGLYSDLLEEVLDLKPLQRGRVEDFLQDHFERLNLKGFAGPRPPAIPELDWISSREAALTSAIEGVQTVIPEVLPDAGLLKSVFHLPDILAADPKAHPLDSPVASLLAPENLPSLPGAAAPLPLPHLPLLR